MNTQTTNLSKNSLLTPSEAAKILNVHPQTLRRYQERKLFSSIKTSGGHRRYNKNKVLTLSKMQKEGKVKLPSLENIPKEDSSLISNDALLEGLLKNKPSQSIKEIF